MFRHGQGVAEATATPATTSTTAVAGRPKVIATVATPMARSTQHAIHRCGAGIEVWVHVRLGLRVAPCISIGTWRGRGWIASSLVRVWQLLLGRHVSASKGRAVPHVVRGVVGGLAIARGAVRRSSRRHAVPCVRVRHRGAVPMLGTHILLVGVRSRCGFVSSVRIGGGRSGVVALLGKDAHGRLLLKRAVATRVLLLVLLRRNTLGVALVLLGLLCLLLLLLLVLLHLLWSILLELLLGGGSKLRILGRLRIAGGHLRQLGITMRRRRVGWLAKHISVCTGTRASTTTATSRQTGVVVVEVVMISSGQILVMYRTRNFKKKINK